MIVFLVIAAVAALVAWLVTINRRWNEAIEAERLQEQIRAQRERFMADWRLLTTAQRAFQQPPDSSTTPGTPMPANEHPVPDSSELRSA